LLYFVADVVSRAATALQQSAVFVAVFETRAGVKFWHKIKQKLLHCRLYFILLHTRP